MLIPSETKPLCWPGWEGRGVLPFRPAGTSSLIGLKTIHDPLELKTGLFQPFPIWNIDDRPSGACKYGEALQILNASATTLIEVSRSITLNSDPDAVKLAHQVDEEPARAVLMGHRYASLSQLFGDTRLELGIDPALTSARDRLPRSGLDRLDMREPVTDRSRPVFLDELTYWRRMENVNLVAGAGEGNVEHSLNMRALLLASTERRTTHDIGVIGQRVENYVALVSLEPIRIHDHQLMLIPLGLLDSFANQLLNKLDLLLEQTQHPNARHVVVRIDYHLLEQSNNRFCFLLVLLAPVRDSPALDIVKLHQRLIG